MSRLTRQTLDTPIGPLMVAACDERVCAVEFTDQEERFEKALSRFADADNTVSTGLPAPIVDAFDAYFNGDADALDAVAVETRGTEFQESVWQALRTVGAGETISYSELAERVGRPDASRAVGLANGMNPVALVIPCHRVIGKNGSLTGYAGGLARKAWLLNHESAQPQGQLDLH